MSHPLVQEIYYQDPLLIFSAWAYQQGAIWLDSAQLMEGCGRYSYIAVDPFLVMTSKNGEIFLNAEKIVGNPWEILREQLQKFTCSTLADLPPFQGGVAGFFSYDLYQHLEKVMSQQVDDMKFPDLAVGFYDVVLAFDHVLRKAWIFSSGFPEMDSERRKNRAEKRLRERIKKIEENHHAKQSETRDTSFRCHDKNIQANFFPEQYCLAVQKVKDYILAGDIFEANISQRFQARFSGDSFKLYCALREKNPAPFSAYLLFENTIIASASPERFLKLTEKNVEARPIKGTRARGKTAEEDQHNARELIQSEKDQAENVMIVDLLRNDLSRVCEPHSVKVPQLCGLESYASVHHLVSVVTGKLEKNYHALDLLQAAFPGGSITGAPKIRAMEIIAEIEPTRRGPYCGCIGFISFNGDMDMSIVIRTYVIKDQQITFQSGGAVTMDSDPVSEYEETLTKAQALKKNLYDFVN